jgi:transposase
MSTLDDATIDDLRDALIEVGDKPTQRLMAVINYLEEDDISMGEIAERYGFSGSWMSKWVKRLDRLADEPAQKVVNDEPREGRTRKLSKNKLAELESILQEGAEEQGFLGQRWTGNRVARVIEEEFGVNITERTARRYMTELGWSHKKPKRVAVERDPENIKQFRNEKWMKIRNEAKQDGKQVVFADESKFRLLPEFLGTWAPKGEEATVESKSTFDFIAVIGALTYMPDTQEFDFQYATQRYNFNAESILPFLRDVTRGSLRDPIFLLDNWKPHKTAVNELREEYADTPTEIQVEYFPEYASDLNPADRVWGLAKNAELANYAPKSLDKLEEKVVSAFENTRTDEAKLRYCVKDAELNIEA